MQLLARESYLQAIENSVGARLFQNLFAKKDGISVDLTEGGNLSCALFVSSILMLHHLIDPSRAPHATVNGLLRNMEDSGWKTGTSIVPGAILVWEAMVQGGSEPHTHIGFALSESEAISNMWEKRTPEKHHIYFGMSSDGSPIRKITNIYKHDILSV